ncbi:MAG TPA: gas vesicle protein GvpD [Pyrinomonadaceae bacterium]|nr:gas vesicle protein GvpD [Pyrinomonadaceae bacterium]
MDKTEITNPVKISTGIEGLDYILKGGLPRNRLYLMQGNPGTGKTTIGLQFLLEGERKGEKGLYITMSESKEELIAVGHSHGWNLENLNIYDLTISGDSLTDDSRYTVFHPSEVELDETTQAVLAEVERTNPARVVFDSLSEMRMLASESLRFRRQILALKQYFIGKSATVILLDDRTTETNDRQLESIAHGVINLDYSPSDYGKQRHSMRVVKMRGVDFQSGTHDFNIETGGVVIFPRLGAPISPNVLTTGTLRSNVDDIEELLGGLDYGTSTILTGPAGIGKSTMALMYAHTAAEKGERAAIYLFDEAVETLYKRTAALGLDVEKYVENGLIYIRQVQLAELTPGELGHLIRTDIEKNDTRVVVIDSVNGYLMATPQERFLTMQFHELLSYLNRRGIVSILVVGQYGLVGNMQTPIDLSYLADTVVLLRYFEAQGEVRQAISVLKKRTGKHERTIREFRIAEGGIRLGQPLTEFHGVLTGIPVYHGKSEGLMEKGNNDNNDGTGDSGN